MMPATNDVIEGPLITLPKEAGDVDAPRFEPNDDWLHRASPEQQMTAMWRWFATRFECAETAVPHDEGGEYAFVEGGPWHADHELRERFEHCVPRDVIERLVQRVQHLAGNDWSKRRIEEAGAGG